MLKLAWRNLWRNRGRTFIILTAFSLSLGMLLMSMGMSDFMHRQMEHAAVDTAGGSILIEGDGYWASQSSDIVITDPGPILALAEGFEGVEVVVPRVHIMGLLNSPRGSSGARISGIVPDREAHLYDYSKYLLPGGTFLEEGEKDPLVLGVKIVEELELELGDRVVLTATDADGEVVRALFHLTGIIETGVKEADAGMALTTVKAAQDAISLGDGLSQIGIVIADDEDRFRLRDELAAALGERADGLELLTWDEAIPEMVGFIEIDDAFFYVYCIVIFIVVLFGVANTLLMAVMERVRELGLLAAIGLTPGQTARLVFLETILMGILALAIGYGLGYAGHLYLLNAGLDLKDFTEMDMNVSGVALVDTVMRSEIRPLKWFTFGALLFVGVLMTALYPAWKAARLDPSQAMRTYE